MTNNEIVQKLWNLCNVLRDDGITYHEYVTEITYILFLKMASEIGNDENVGIPEKYRWNELKKLKGLELRDTYQRALLDLGKIDGNLGIIYKGAQTRIEEPANLAKIFSEIDKIDWYSVDKEDLGDLYEGLLEKNASEKKSGAGQYFTPRVLIDSMVRVSKPEIGEKVCDPAAGTLGFIIEADKYLKRKYDSYFDLSEEEQEFQRNEAFSGCELVPDTHRLATMNALLHDINGHFLQGDSLSELGKELKSFDLILSNPPFGTKKGGERVTRDDLTYETSNKQLNFVQVIYKSLKKTGKARAAVVLPDNVLFEGGVGKEIRKDLMNKCNLHTILRLPTGIFYAQGVKTNVLFFTRGKEETGNTKEIWYYDLRTNMPNFGKTNQLKESHFQEFEETFHDLEKKREIERWNLFTMEDIEKKDYSLDMGLIKDDSVIDSADLPNPAESASEAIDKLEQAVDLLKSIIKELHICGVKAD